MTRDVLARKLAGLRIYLADLSPHAGKSVRYRATLLSFVYKLDGYEAEFPAVEATSSPGTELPFARACYVLDGDRLVSAPRRIDDDSHAKVRVTRGDVERLILRRSEVLII